MSDFQNAFGEQAALNQIAVPDLWQQQAIVALREGKDVIVHAPTGAGKTLVFEHWAKKGRIRGQAVYTVPTRALANDKLAEWRRLGWNVGIATGDISENLQAQVVVATLETQKPKLIKGEGPDLLVIDEYQMIADPDRGLNYELALAMAPATTQLLLLSGSVENPQHVARWLERLGRKVEVVRHEVRPVPLEEVHGAQFRHWLPNSVQGYWPQLIAQALIEDLGPILIFAPQRKSAEALANELARSLPEAEPIELSSEQKQLLGSKLTKLIRSRVAYHHSGLSYAARAGVIEPLTKFGQLRVVVATMGLAAGINFSLRTVVIAGSSYKRGYAEHALRSDEILQMFGRAGRRGIDETGYGLVSRSQVRLNEGYPIFLSRSGMVDWGALLGVMSVAADKGDNPFEAAVRVQERLFTTKPIFLGVEESLRFKDTPCGLKTDAERARFVRNRVQQILNSDGVWRRRPKYVQRPLSDIKIIEETVDGEIRLRSILSDENALVKFGPGTLVEIDRCGDEPVFGKSITLGERLEGGRISLTKPLRRMLNWKGKYVTDQRWGEKIEPLIMRRYGVLKTPVLKILEADDKILAWLSIEELVASVPVDDQGVPLWRPPQREVLQPDCKGCRLQSNCMDLSTTTGVAALWLRLKLVDQEGRPTRRGKIVSFFAQGHGLAIAVALEDDTYPLDELVYDLANLDAGFRFCGDENRWEGRLTTACHEAFGLKTSLPYLENGTPPGYGWGAERIVLGVHRDPKSKHSWVTESVGAGDIDRIIIEWRSLLRRIAYAPDLTDWARWEQLKLLSKNLLNETCSPTETDLPSLPFQQKKRISHRLRIKKNY